MKKNFFILITLICTSCMSNSKLVQKTYEKVVNSENLSQTNTEFSLSFYDNSAEFQPTKYPVVIKWGKEEGFLRTANSYTQFTYKNGKWIVYEKSGIVFLIDRKIMRKTIRLVKNIKTPEVP